MSDGLIPPTAVSERRGRRLEPTVLRRSADGTAVNAAASSLLDQQVVKTRAADGEGNLPTSQEQ